jgi:uncharacterized protein YecE (DUF72 family)
MTQSATQPPLPREARGGGASPAGSGGRGRVLVGCSGWNYAHWRHGVFYPERMPATQWLRYYAERFETVEVNASFYRLPRREVVARWAQGTPPGFTLTIKVSRYLTHIVRLKDTASHLAFLLERIDPLVRCPEKLGPLLWQLPPSMARDDERLAASLAEWPKGFRHAIEFRHESWFADDVMAMLREHGAALVIADGPKVRSFQRHELTTDWTYVRFHAGARGRNGNYSHSELEEWAERVDGWAANGDVYAYFNNDWEGYAPENAVTLRSLVAQRAAG